MNIYRVIWHSPALMPVLDEHEFKTALEAETYAGIEMTQMEAEQVERYEIVIEFREN